jgi:hypothetical protein
MYKVLGAESYSGGDMQPAAALQPVASHSTPITKIPSINSPIKTKKPHVLLQ